MDARCAPVVAGSPRPITTEQFNGPVAQSAERRSYKADVVRAIRTGTTKNAVLAGYVGRIGCKPVVLVTRKVRFLGAAPLDRSIARRSSMRLLTARREFDSLWTYHHFAVT